MNKFLATVKSYLPIACIFFAMLLSACTTGNYKQPVLEPQPEQQLDQVPVALLNHGQTITTSKPIRNVPISISYLGSAIYHVQVNNTLQSEITLLWDRSSYLTTTGESVRLLRLDLDNIPVTAPARQADSAISPHEQFQADFSGDDWLDCARRKCSPRAKNTLKTATIFLTFKINRKTIRWQGSIAFAPAER